MIEVKVIDKDNGRMAIHSGDFCMCITSTDGESNVNLFGITHIFDFAKIAGICLNTLIKNMAKNENEPYASELIAKHFFLEKFYEEVEKEPKGEGATNPDGPKNNNTI